MIDFWYLTPLSAIFQQYHATSFSDGRSQSTQREQPIMGNQLVNFITCGCESSAQLCVITQPNKAKTLLN
jgi:hypothetical protein